MRPPSSMLPRRCWRSVRLRGFPGRRSVLLLPIAVVVVVTTRDVSLLRVLGHILLTIIVGAVVVVVVSSSNTVSVRVGVLLGGGVRGVGVMRRQDVVVVSLTPSSEDGSENAEPEEDNESEEDHRLCGCSRYQLGKGSRFGKPLVGDLPE